MTEKTEVKEKKKKGKALAQPKVAAKKAAPKVTKVIQQAPADSYTLSTWHGHPLIECAKCGYSTIDGQPVFNRHYFSLHHGKKVQVKEAAAGPPAERTDPVKGTDYTLGTWSGKQLIDCELCGFNTIDGMDAFVNHWKHKHNRALTNKQMKAAEDKRKKALEGASKGESEEKTNTEN